MKQLNLAGERHLEFRYISGVTRDLGPEETIDPERERTEYTRRERLGAERDDLYAGKAARDERDHEPVAPPPRPAWMDNPSLLPKRPPGR